MPKACQNCGKQDRLAACKACGRAHYCSAECQKIDWKFHKDHCKIDKEKAPVVIRPTEPGVTPVRPKERQSGPLPKKTESVPELANQLLKGSEKMYIKDLKDIRNRARVAVIAEIETRNYSPEKKREMYRHCIDGAKIFARKRAALHEHDFSLASEHKAFLEKSARLFGIPESHFVETEERQNLANKIFVETTQEAMEKVLAASVPQPTVDEDFEEPAPGATKIDLIRVNMRNRARALGNMFYPDVAEDESTNFTFVNGKVTEVSAADLNAAQKKRRQEMIDSAFETYTDAKTTALDQTMQMLRNEGLIEMKRAPRIRSTEIDHPPAAVGLISPEPKESMSAIDILAKIKVLESLESRTREESSRLLSLRAAYRKAQRQEAQDQQERKIKNELTPNGIDSSLFDFGYGASAKVLGITGWGFWIYPIACVLIASVYLGYATKPAIPMTYLNRTASEEFANHTFAPFYQTQIALANGTVDLETGERTLITHMKNAINYTQTQIYGTQATVSPELEYILQNFTREGRRLTSLTTYLEKPEFVPILASVYHQKKSEEVKAALKAEAEGFSGALDTVVSTTIQTQLIAETQKATELVKTIRSEIAAIPLTDGGRLIPDIEHKVATVVAFLDSQIKWYQPESVKSNWKIVGKITEKLNYILDIREAAAPWQLQVLKGQFHDLIMQLDNYFNRIHFLELQASRLREFSRMLIASSQLATDPVEDLIANYILSNDPNFLTKYPTKGPEYFNAFMTHVKNMACSFLYWDLIESKLSPKEENILLELDPLVSEFSKPMNETKFNQVLENSTRVLNKWENESAIIVQTRQRLQRKSAEQEIETKILLFQVAVARAFDAEQAMESRLNLPINPLKWIALASEFAIAVGALNPLKKALERDDKFSAWCLFLASPWLFISRCLQLTLLVPVIKSLVYDRVQSTVFGTAMTAITTVGFGAGVTATEAMVAMYQAKAVMSMASGLERVKALNAASIGKAILHGGLLFSLAGLNLFSSQATARWPHANRSDLIQAIENLGPYQRDQSVNWNTIREKLNSTLPGIGPFIFQQELNAQTAKQLFQYQAFVEREITSLTERQQREILSHRSKYRDYYEGQSFNNTIMTPDELAASAVQWRKILDAWNKTNVTEVEEGEEPVEPKRGPVPALPSSPPVQPESPSL